MTRMRLLLLLAFCLWSVSAADESIVQTQYGQVRGIVGDDFRAFLGIPFIKPPVGNLRFAKPEEPTPWTPTILNTTKYQPSCPQHCTLPVMACPNVTSEDCIYINIFTPRAAKLTTKQPVMVFLHGGNFQQGSGGFILYDGRQFVRLGNVIVVTVNYRLGALGWLVTPNSVSGNLGLLDQREGFKFVHNNIANFGGDPDQITVFGQSAGATSIAVHLVSPLSKGMFSRAILQSNPFTLPLQTPEVGRQHGQEFLKSLGCADTLECLRSKTPDEIIAAEVDVDKTVDYSRILQTFYPWTPNMDGVQFSEYPLYAMRKGLYHKMPLIIGTVTNEVLLFIYEAMHSSVNAVEYVGGLEYIFGFEDGAYVIYEYPPQPWDGDQRNRLGQVGTYYVFHCSIRNLTLNIYNDNPLYFYHFDHVVSFDFWGSRFPECADKVCHGEELPILFASAPLFGLNLTAEEQKLSDLMLTYWTNFARTADPNKGLNKPPLIWPQYDPKARQNVHFATPSSNIEVNFQHEACDFFDTIGYHHGW